MRKSALLAGLVLCVPVLWAANSQAHAEVPQIILSNASVSTSSTPEYKALEVVSAELLKQQDEQRVQAEKPVEHIVAAGETLTTIANKHQTSWQRLYAKNVHIANPDVIDVGEKLVIPKPNEQLAERALPAPPPVEITAVQPKTAPKNKSAKVAAPEQAPARQVSPGSSGGNTYTPGYCTWYVKNKRPDLPNNLGNADTWVSRAAAQGIPTGSAPRVGAAGQRGMHVVYVESVNGDGTVTISEMNHKGLWVVSTRTVPASYFTYIY
jgi:surface antigen